MHGGHGSVAGRNLRGAVMLLITLLGVAACGNASSARKVTSPPAATAAIAAPKVRHGEVTLQGLESLPCWAET